jgi:thioredoxin 1
VIVPLQQSPVDGQNAFFGLPLILWTILPILLAIFLARRRSKKKPEPPHVDDRSFDELVLRSDLPVLVHFYRSWSIGDRVMVNTGQNLAVRNAANARTFWLDVDANPETVARFPNLETPAFVFFADGKRIFHAEGVVDEADVQREMWMAHERHLRMKGRDRASPSSPSAEPT